MNINSAPFQISTAIETVVRPVTNMEDLFALARRMNDVTQSEIGGTIANLTANVGRFASHALANAGNEEVAGDIASILVAISMAATARNIGVDQIFAAVTKHAENAVALAVNESIGDALESIGLRSAFN